MARRRWRLTNASVAGAKRRRDLPPMKLAKYLANLGYGSRREIEWLMSRRRVTAADGRTLATSSGALHRDIRVDGEPLDPPPGSVLMMHKPTGYVCSTKDDSPLVYALLPERFPRRSPIMAPIGRLDINTSGLLLLTDDGQLNHRITSPRAHLPKTYEVHLAEPVGGDEIALFASGTMLLASESEPLRPAVLEPVRERFARVTLTEGRYHQVRRMFAATGNHVTALHRSGIGNLTLGDLPPGAWRALDERELQAVFTVPPCATLSGLPAAP